MSKRISISSHWALKGQPLLLDVRTPAEFTKGHIPGAVNLPLFTDKERVIVGTLYKQEGPEKALLKGLDFVGPKMSEFVRQTKRLTSRKSVTVYCWRGGKRSFSLSWLLTLAGFEVYTLEGGYKAYRNYVLKNFGSISSKMIVLGGMTGCGKTRILQELEKRGEQVIDLERMAHHKGSAFGGVGEKEQPTVEQFENNLFEVFRQTNPENRLWIENESKNIGRIYLPENFWFQMKAAPLINITLPFEERLDIIVRQYGDYQKEFLMESFLKIKKRLGGLKLKEALEALGKNDLRTAAGIALNYYDKSYKSMLEENEAPIIKHLSFENQSSGEIAQQLLHVVSSSKDLLAFNYQLSINE